MSQQSKKSSRKWIWIGLVILVIGAGVIVWKNTQKTKTTYKEFVVKRGDLEITILATGTLQPENRLSIKAPLAGRIDQVLVTEGVRVRRGQIIAWMSSTERAALLDAARARGPEDQSRAEGHGLAVERSGLDEDHRLAGEGATEARGLSGLCRLLRPLHQGSQEGGRPHRLSEHPERARLRDRKSVV